MVWDAASGGFAAFTLPFRVVKWNGQKFNSYNFTDMNVEPTVKLVIYGTNPAMFLSKKDINFAGPVHHRGSRRPPAARPPTRTARPTMAAPARPPPNTAGGIGGSGPSGGVQGECSGEMITAGGGGGGGNAKHGKSGPARKFIPSTPAARRRTIPPVPAACRCRRTSSWAAAAAARAGGGFWAGDFYGQPGANGGGAVIFSARLRSPSRAAR